MASCLGLGTVILGFAMIAGEFYPAARWMDRLEVRCRRILGPLGRAFAGLPTWARLTVSLTVALASLALVYGLYHVSFVA
jgi:hypothetical protein